MSKHIFLGVRITRDIKQQLLQEAAEFGETLSETVRRKLDPLADVRMFSGERTESHKKHIPSYKGWYRSQAFPSRNARDWWVSASQPHFVNEDIPARLHNTR